MSHEVEQLKSQVEVLNMNISKLKNNKQQLELVIKSTGVGIWDWYVQTGKTIFNERWANIIGYTLEELSPVSIETWMEHAHPDDLEESGRLLEEHWAGGTEYYIFESRMKHKDGHWVWVNDTGQVIEWESNGAPKRMIGTHLDISEEKTLKLEKEASIKHLNYALDASGDGIWDWTPFNGITVYSKAWLEMLGYKVGELASLASEWSDRLHPDDAEWVFAEINKVTQTPENGDTISHEYRFRNKAGSYLWILNKAKAVERNEQGQATRVVGTHTNITKEKAAEEKLKRAASVFTHTHEGIIITDGSGSITEVNDAFSRITGYAPEDVLGEHPRIFHSDRQSPEFYAEMGNTLLTQGYWHGEVWNCRKNGEIYLERLTISAERNTDGLLQHYVSLISDITLMKEHQTQLERMAHNDALTHLPNRVLLADRLNQSMLQCQRRNQSLAVAFMDLDGFKVVNDLHGHNVGDELLIEVAHRMKEALREGDTLARIGGDEFIAVIVDLENIEDSEPVLKRLLKASSDPVYLHGAVMQVSASIGVSFYPQDQVDADLLMRHADQAMYIAKQAGKNRYHFFDTAQDSASKTLGQNIGDIRSALEKCEFVLHYQPKVNMHTGEAIGVEALIRWQHPVRGLVPPLEFLPAIEGHAVSLELGEWVIDTALSQITQWRNIGVTLSISVNISAYQLQQRNFAARLASLLSAHPEVPPHYLELEILETSVLSDISQVFDTMSACHDLGVRFALDDFGTGYSSLTHIKRLPAYLIKIDQSFVRDMLEDVDDLAIVESVIGLAKTFKREVIAEGVETIEHGEALLKLGCELAQGYGIARPMPAEDIPEWLDAWKPHDSWQTYKG